MQQELIRQYYNRGKYNVSVIPNVIELDRNRVAIDIEIREGKVAKIKEDQTSSAIRLSRKGNQKGFESGTTNWLSWYSKNDQYSREKLSGDLEKLQSYYTGSRLRGFRHGFLPGEHRAGQTRDVHHRRRVEGEIYTISDTQAARSV